MSVVVGVGAGWFIGNCKNMAIDQLFYRIWFKDGKISIVQLNWYEVENDGQFWFSDKLFNSEAEAIAWLESKILSDEVVRAIKEFLGTGD